MYSGLCSFRRGCRDERPIAAQREDRSASCGDDQSPGGDRQGASTISQQYARKWAELEGVTYGRKLREAVIALKQWNTKVEKDVATLQADLAAAHERASRFERAIARLPSIIQNWLSRHAR